MAKLKVVSHSVVPFYQGTEIYLRPGLYLTHVLTEDARNSQGDRHVSDLEGIEPKIWVVSPGEIECDHPPDQLRDLGTGGLNGYYQCERCEGDLIIRNDVDYLHSR